MARDAMLRIVAGTAKPCTCYADCGTQETNFFEKGKSKWTAL
jgi:hypothetical protein